MKNYFKSEYMYQIKIPIGSIAYDYLSFRSYCAHFQCNVIEPKRGHIDYVIETDEYVNFYWLGLNLNFRHDTPLSISPASLHLKQK